MELHLIGGFLGSGKTTAILEAARLLVERGQRVGIITNEQGKHLVDTGFLRASGLPALEVTGGCVCCQLDDFADRVEEITAKFNPQVLFAESVGSCTDLVATVVKPLVDYRKTSAQPASLSVFSDSRLLLRYLRDQELPFSESVIYIFEKQIVETNLLIANKIDLLSDADARDLLRLAVEKYPHKTIRPQNSLNEGQVAEWLALIQSQTLSLPEISLDLDYDAYAGGEGRFAWVDRELSISLPELNPGAMAADLIRRFVRAISKESAQIAHLKFLVSDGSRQLRLNFTSLDEPEVKMASQLPKLDTLAGNQINLLVNLMAEGDVSALETALNAIILFFAEENNITIQETARFSCVPGYPKPTMRIGNQKFLIKPLEETADGRHH